MRRGNFVRRLRFLNGISRRILRMRKGNRGHGFIKGGREQRMEIKIPREIG